MNEMSFEDDSVATDDELQQVAALARKQQQQERDVTRLEEELKNAKNALYKTRVEALPTLLSEIGLMSITLSDGSTIVIDESLYATIPKKNKASAAQWLKDHGQGSLVKSDVSLTLGTGEEEKLGRLTALLDSTEFSEYSLTSSMNTGSVKAVIKELLAQGVDVPLKLFGAHFERKSIIK